MKKTFLATAAICRAERSQEVSRAWKAETEPTAANDKTLILTAFSLDFPTEMQWVRTDLRTEI